MNKSEFNISKILSDIKKESLIDNSVSPLSIKKDTSSTSLQIREEIAGNKTFPDINEVTI